MATAHEVPGSSLGQTGCRALPPCSGHLLAPLKDFTLTTRKKDPLSIATPNTKPATRENLGYVGREVNIPWLATTGQGAQGKGFVP